MSLPALPTEIHELVIDFIAALAPIDRRKALPACALVCASWHSFALRHIFQTIRLPSDVMTGGALPSTIILRLMEGNPEIRRCVKSLSVSRAILPPSMHDAFEQVCRLCTAVSHLSIHRDVPNLNSSPLMIRNGISLLLKSPSLRQLSFFGTFRSSFLEAALLDGLAVLTFNRVADVVLDHENWTKFSRLLLRKVKFWGSEKVISKMQQTPGLSQLFERTQHFHIIVDFPESVIQPATLWNRNLTWGNCTSMDMTFGFLVELNQDFFSYFHDFPWSSLNVLKRLKITLLLAERRPPIGTTEVSAVTPWIAKASKMHLRFLSGPSRLKTLENLVLKYHFLKAFRSKARVDETFRELFCESLDGNFRHGDAGFPYLGTFDLCVNITGTPGVFGDSGMMKKVVKMDTEKCLPSVFGLGGRCEVDGWAARVDVDWSVKDDDLSAWIG